MQKNGAASVKKLPRPIWGLIDASGITPRLLFRCDLRDLFLSTFRMR